MNMSKKITALLLSLLFCCSILAGCGEKETNSQAPDLQKVYDEMAASGILPDMVTVPNEKGEYYFGILPTDCRQEITAICQSSLLADEVWLIEANDDDAANGIEKLASARVEQKGIEMKNYAPDQYQIVQEAKIIRQGSCVVLLISSQGEKLEEIFRTAK